MPNALPPVPPAWDDAIQRFVVDQNGDHKSARTISARVYHLKRFALATPVPPDRLNRDHIAGYLGKPNWKATNTYNVVRGHLRAFLVFAEDRGIVPRGLLAVLPPPRKQATRIPRAAPQSVVENALATPDPRDRKMVILSALGGLKPGEIAQLHTDQLQPDADGEDRLIARQTSGRERIVLLRPDVAALIRETGDGYVFPGRVDGHISPAYVSRLISRTLPKGMSALQLRHAFEEALVRHSWTAQSAMAAAPGAERVAVATSALHPWVWDAARDLWGNDHRREALQAACTGLNEHLQHKLGRNDMSDRKLIAEAFSEKPPTEGRARLRFPELNRETAESMRQGASSLGVGCFAAIRNVITHNLAQPEKAEALEQLAALSLFARWVERATVEQV